MIADERGGDDLEGELCPPRRRAARLLAQGGSEGLHRQGLEFTDTDSQPHDPGVPPTMALRKGGT